MWRYSNKTLIGLSCLIYFFALNAHTMGIYRAPTVKISNGSLEGKIMMSKSNNEIHAYQGIPYAAPPVGDLRFKPPEPPSAWNGTRSAVRVSRICLQIDLFYEIKYDEDEDCLYLNVYTPSIKIHPEYPVMVFFHGGGWLSGEGNSRQPHYLLDHNVVLVTVNYRLGPLGFLSTEDLECPGNLGLKDQQQALRWVQENIAYFNGDPTSVTIFGQSAGSASVHYHMVSPLSKGLFHRAITQSGTFYNPWALMPPGSANSNTKILGCYLNCTTENSTELIACLRTKSARNITATFSGFKILDICPHLIPFVPVIEPEHLGAFLTEDPTISVQKGHIADVPWITGINSEEGSLFTSSIYNWNFTEILNNEFMKLAPVTLFHQIRYQFPNQNFVNEITNDIHKQYFNQSNIDESKEATFNMINMYSDAWFNYGTYRAVRDFVANKTSPVYFYYFTYKGNSLRFGNSTKDYGVTHGAEMEYLFPPKNRNRNVVPYQNKSKDDKDMIDLMTTLWYNFALSGNPTPNNTQLQWNSTKSNSLEDMFVIDGKNSSMKSGLLTKRMSFWDCLENRMESASNETHFCHN
ncbi:esterase E4-like [Linepithema humile]|uniref:esterase E4-like n=1 Tax=Linepithema humile TaxID=83485 RepID=UPI00351E772A